MRTLLIGMACCAIFLFSCNDHREPVVVKMVNADEVSMNDSSSDVALDVAALLAQEKNIVERAPMSSNNQLAFDLYRKMRVDDGPVYSPFSISLALAMAYAGASGETEAAMKAVLYFGENSTDFHKSYGQFANLLSKKDRSMYDAVLNISNEQWLQKDYKIIDDFRNVVAQSYAALPRYLDFINDPALATDAINMRVREQTKGEIPTLLKSPLKNDTRFVLTNAMYFNAKWDREFKNFQTQEGMFTTKHNEQTEVRYMKQVSSFPYNSDDNRQILLMPYRDEDFAAVFILPREGKLDAVEEMLTADYFSEAMSSLLSTKIDLWLPQFSQRFVPHLKELLTSMGLGIIFDEEKVDFSKINGVKIGDEKLYIADVVHEAVVKMYEAGTTAAAATGIVGASVTSMPAPDEPVEFHATRPFLFFIMHKESKTILFMGRVDKPAFAN